MQSAEDPSNKLEGVVDLSVTVLPKNYLHCCQQTSPPVEKSGFGVTVGNSLKKDLHLMR